MRMNNKKLFDIPDALAPPQGPTVYWIPAEGVNIQIKKMPNRFHRYMVKLFFGWTFEIKSTENKRMLYG
jgi:hypothetical protein